MIWDYTEANGIDKVVLVSEMMNGTKYIDELEKKMRPSARFLLRDDNWKMTMRHASRQRKRCANARPKSWTGPLNVQINMVLKICRIEQAAWYLNTNRKRRGNLSNKLSRLGFGRLRWKSSQTRSILLILNCGNSIFLTMLRRLGLIYSSVAWWWAGAPYWENRKIYLMYYNIFICTTHLRLNFLPNLKSLHFQIDLRVGKTIGWILTSQWANCGGSMMWSWIITTPNDINLIFSIYNSR